jgi:hypothetical protein
MHFGEHQQSDANNIEIMNKLIEKAKPDLVVVTGDAISGYSWDKTDDTFFQRNWQLLTSVFTK